MAVNYCGKKFYNIGPWLSSVAVTDVFDSKLCQCTRAFDQGMLTKGEGSVRLTSSLSMLVLYKGNLCLQYQNLLI
jgi:hypothetical protein